jgi:hypothetical protein
MLIDQPSDNEDTLHMINTMKSTITRLSEIPKKIIFLVVTSISLIATITSVSVKLVKVSPPTAMPTILVYPTAMPTILVYPTAMPTILVYPTAMPTDIPNNPTKKPTDIPNNPTKKPTDIPNNPTKKPTKKKGN